MDNLDLSIEEIVDLLIYKHPDVLKHIDSRKIMYEHIEKGKGAALRITGVNKTASDFMAYTDINERYKITIDDLLIELYNPHQLQWALMELLLSIGENCDGQIESYNFQSYIPIVNVISRLGLGANYMGHPDLPSLIDDNEMIFFYS